MSELSPKEFKHKYTVTVRFHEVDMLGVCNNAVYINFFESARLEYIKAAGLMPEKGIFSDGNIFFMVILGKVRLYQSLVSYNHSFIYNNPGSRFIYPFYIYFQNGRSKVCF